MERIKIKPRQLYQGCILAAIIHAVTVGEYPELNYEHSWNGFNYCMDNSRGCKATITFHPQYIVAVFQDISKFNLQSDVYDYLSGIPDNILEVAKSETLQYVLNDIDGKRKPIITAAFWGTWRELFSNQLWNEIRNNGGYIIENQLLDYQKSLKRWDDYYGLNNRQMDLIDSLYRQKISYSKKPILLNKNEICSLYGDIEECKKSLGELDIYF